MATKIVKKNSDKTLDIVKGKAKNLNKVALKTTHEIVDETIATGEQWQDLLAKTLKKGIALFGKQQDLMLTGLEELKDQYAYGNKRFWKLFSIKPSSSKALKSATKKSKAVAKKVGKSIDEVLETATKTEKAVKKTVKVVAKKAAPKSRATAPKKTAKKVAGKVVKKVTVKTTKLTLIEGIGPKIQELLNKAGIKNFDQLAKAKKTELKKILANGGSRFQMHDPSTWAAQSKLAAAGKMDTLKTMQDKLKGGKK